MCVCVCVCVKVGEAVPQAAAFQHIRQQPRNTRGAGGSRAMPRLLHLGALAGASRRLPSTAAALPT